MDEKMLQQLAKLLQKEKPVSVPKDTPPSQVVDAVKSQLIPGRVHIAHPSLVEYMKRQRREVNK